MTPEQEAIQHCLTALRATNECLSALTAQCEKLEAQQIAISAAIRSMHHRLQLQECGTALYEISNGIPRGAH